MRFRLGNPRMSLFFQIIWWPERQILVSLFLILKVSEFPSFILLYLVPASGMKLFFWVITIIAVRFGLNYLASLETVVVVEGRVMTKPKTYMGSSWNICWMCKTHKPRISVTSNICYTSQFWKSWCDCIWLKWL